MTLALRNPAKEKLLAGGVSIGSWCTSGSPLAAEVLAGEGFPWVVVDMEHFPIDLSAAADCFRAIHLAGAVPLGRVPACDGVWIKRVLDAGPLGIVVPLLESAQDARNVVAWSRFPPTGRRPFGGGRASHLYGPSYLQQANQAILVMIQIETAQAVEELDAILAVKGYDGCFVGPTDLSLSLGMPPPSQPHPPRDQLIRSLAGRIAAAGKIPGIFATSVQAAVARVQEGYRLVGVAADLLLLRDAAGGVVGELKKNGLL
jgi:4-hydroxy-2-oxoheptanedioate aldolase